MASLCLYGLTTVFLSIVPRPSAVSMDCDYWYPDAIDIVMDNRIDNVTIYDVIELSFDLRIDANFTCDSGWCNILRIGVPHQVSPKFPMIALTPDSFHIAVTENTGNEQYKVDDVQFLNQITNGSYHHFDLQITPTERVLIYNGDTVYINKSGDFNSDSYLSSQGTEYSLLVCGENPYTPTRGTVKNLCINSYPHIVDPTMDPTTHPTAVPTVSPTTEPTLSPSPFPSPSPSFQSASITLHCDNTGELFLSHNGGDTFITKGMTTEWTTAYSWTITNVTNLTVLQFHCTDNGVAGGFIATVTYDDAMYSTRNPMDDSYWKVVSSDDGVTSPLMYTAKSEGPWYRNTDPIEDEASWIWNGNTHNTMVFEFDFGDLFGTVFVHRNYTLSLNGSYNALEHYALSTNHTMNQIALNIVSSFVSTRSGDEVVIDIYNVLRGSVIIEYGLSSNNKDALNQTESNFASSIGSDIVMGNVTLSVASNQVIYTKSLSPETTLSPSESPSIQPTDSPTNVPIAPSTNPTMHPSLEPTSIPSMFPTTPSPTHPPELRCGSHQSGAYNGWPLRFKMEMMERGNIEFVASNSDFVITSITAMNEEGDRLVMDSDHDDVLILHGITAGDYVFVVTSGDKDGIYEVDVLCTSDDRRRLAVQEDGSVSTVFSLYLIIGMVLLVVIANLMRGSPRWMEWIDAVIMKLRMIGNKKCDHLSIV